MERVRVLFDSGCSGTLVNKKFLKELPLTRDKNTQWSTKAGQLKTKYLADIVFILPAFHEKKEIYFNVYVDESPSENSRYDMIIGRDALHELGIDLCFSEGTITWDYATIKMQNPELLDNKWLDKLESEIFYMHDPVTTDAERIQSIIDNKYSPADLEEVASKIQNINNLEKEKLLKLLNKFAPLFDGSLGTWKTEPVNLELKPEVKPYHARPFPVPYSQEKKLKEEINRLLEYGVLEKVNNSEWAAPMFTISKPDGSLRSLADLRELNKRIKRKPYPLPKIADLLYKLEGFLYATALDLNMGYYHLELTPFASNLCTVVLPWGKYAYKRLPMGICNAPDIFQEKINNLMGDLEFVRAYLDDILIISTEKEGFEGHLEKLEKIFTRLLEAGLKVNASKSKFCQDTLEYLGYTITNKGIQPSVNKITAILDIKPPSTRKQLRRFIGIVNYYRDMWPKRSETLAPLTNLTSKSNKWKWTEVEQNAFDQMKALIAKETLLTYPNFSEVFEIHTDASKVQLGACISQNGKPVAFYSRKLSPAQTRYTTTERELLSIVETLKEFRNILLGQQILVHTDHENLTQKNFNSDRVMRWRLYIEEYSPDLQYIKGTKNIVADALSRLDVTEPDSSDQFQQYVNVLECFAKDAEDDIDVYPLAYSFLAKAQKASKQLMKILNMKDSLYKTQDFHGGGKTYSLVCYKDKIVVPNELQRQVIEWYHTNLVHPGINRTEETIEQHLWWPKMREHITNYVRICPACQRNKRKHKKYGILPPKEAEAMPWDKLCIDLIGPYTIRRKGKDNLICRCVTMIDPATGWFEIEQYDDKRSITIANITEQVWLTRYPRPTQITFDRGSEFIGEDFKTMVKNDYGIKDKPITVRNPQANAIVERVHQVLGNMIRTFELEDNYLDEDDPWKGILCAAAFAIRSTYHTTLKKTPGQLVFGRDMVLNIQHEANWEYIRARKQELINKNNKRENSKRVEHEYKLGDLVLLRRGTENKYERPYNGPYEILKVYDNGTVRLKVKNVVDTYNIRRLTPYITSDTIDHGGECNMRTSRKRRKTNKQAS